jgi:hypothetical protein
VPKTKRATAGKEGVDVSGNVRQGDRLILWKKTAQNVARKPFFVKIVTLLFVKRNNPKL